MTLIKSAALAALLLAGAAPAFAQQSDKMMTPAPTMSDGKAMSDKTMSGNMMETAKPASVAPMMDSAKAMPDSAMGGKMDDKMMNDTKK